MRLRSYRARIFASLVSFVALCCLLPVTTLADIVVQDMIALKGEELMLRAETKGKFFSKGGEVVEFFVNGKSLGKALSGGDGIAFRQFNAEKPGLHSLSVKSAKDEGTALLLVVTKGSRIVFIDVEGGLLEGQFMKKPMKESQKVIKEINKRFPVVFLQTGILGTEATKAWLKENRMPHLPVLPWRQGMVLSDLTEKGAKIKAVVGAPAIIESAKQYNKPLLFSFEETDNAQVVKNWEEIGKKLK